MANTTSSVFYEPDIVKEANERYREGDYDAAVALFTEVWRLFPELQIPAMSAHDPS